MGLVADARYRSRGQASKGCASIASSRAGALRAIGELDAVVGQHGVDLVGNGRDQAQEGCGRDPVAFSSVREGELRGPVDGDEQIEFALLGPDLGDVDVEEADRIGLNFCLAGLSPSTSGSRQMPWRCRQRCKDERVRCGMVACSA